MNRRTLLQLMLLTTARVGATGSALYGADALAADAAKGANDAQGKGQPFTYEILQKQAEAMAKQPYKNPRETLPATLANMTPQQFNDIDFDSGHALWKQPNGKLAAEFFHVGMGFQVPVRMHSVDPKKGLAYDIPFHPELFNYARSGVDTSKLGADLGFSGLKVFKAPHLDKFDIVSFLGASYFRAVDDTGQYGLSARGMAIDTYVPGQIEEFPDFTAFWLETPAPGSTRFRIYALLDSPSATGAYRFDIDCEAKRVIMDIDMHAYARKDIKQLGITPMTSMFSCGPADRRMCLTFHPNVHDSDRLSMWRGNGEWVCRPLTNPEHLSFNTFADTNPRGFGLVQRDHDFASYQDTVDWYSRRPSLWVEPTTQWGEGAIDLMEIPTTGETLDNIVAFWNPKQPIKAGDALHYGYKLHWAALPPVQPSLAEVDATWVGAGGFTEGWAPGEHFPDVWAKRFAIDFVGGPLNEMKPTDRIEVIVSVSGGQDKDHQIFALYPDKKGFRAIFDWYPTSDSVEPVNMRAFIRRIDNKAVLSETWLYQYIPPAPSQRHYG